MYWPILFSFVYIILDLGRWLSPDSYGQYHRPYLAMGNNPISRVDPDGGSDICETCPEGGEFDYFINSDEYFYF